MTCAGLCADQPTDAGVLRLEPGYNPAGEWLQQLTLFTLAAGDGGLPVWFDVRSAVAERYDSFRQYRYNGSLTSPWSNPMKHLIPYLQDDQKAADYLRQVRWPDGVTCPRCGSDAVEPRARCDNGLQRFTWVPCAVR
jgi:hypothetical protein